MSEQLEDVQWWVTWGLESVSFPKGEEPGVFSSARVNLFKIPFGSAKEAGIFAAEIQRFLGDLLLHSSLVTPERLREVIDQVVSAALRETKIK